MVSITVYQLMEQLQHKMENSLAFFLSILLILCLTNVSNKFYHDTGEYQWYPKHKGGLVSVAWGNIVSSHGAATA